MAPSLYGSNDADCDKPVGSGRLRYPSMEESLMGLRTPFPYGLYAGRARSGAALYTRPIYAGIIEGIKGIDWSHHNKITQEARALWPLR